MWIQVCSNEAPRSLQSGEGIITPVFKKGNYNNCDNYRVIILESCLSKLFTLLNERVNNLSENYDIIPYALIGFKAGNSTSDAMLC